MLRDFESGPNMFETEWRKERQTHKDADISESFLSVEEEGRALLKELETYCTILYEMVRCCENGRKARRQKRNCERS